MRKISTLLLFVKNFQADLDNCEIEQLSGFFQQNLTDAIENELFPSDQTVNRILDFARSYEVLKTKTAGYAEMTLN